MFFSHSPIQAFYLLALHGEIHNRGQWPKPVLVFWLLRPASTNSFVGGAHVQLILFVPTE
jgi:hypothetical protein